MSDRELVIRYATIADAGRLAAWWNDGAIMAHAGFPNGLGTTAEKVSAEIANESDDTRRRFIMEISGVAGGEMSYRNLGNGVAEIGIKICDTRYQGCGYGTRVLRLFIGFLFGERGFTAIVLDTNLTNLRAQHVYEKIGFRRVRVNENSWRNQLGELQSSVDYKMTKKEWTGALYNENGN